jgi:TonB family protein
MQPLRVLPFPPRPWSIGPVGVSAITHLGLIALALGVGRLAASVDYESLLPALYLYAPDRQPTAPGADAPTIPAPPGGPLGGRSSTRPSINGDAQLAPVADTGSRRGMGREGETLRAVDAISVDSIYSVLEVDEAVARVPGSSAPVYPIELLQKGVEGAVEAEFVVDTTGLVDLATVRVRSSTDSLFTRSVEAALGDMVFRPARIGHQKVRQLVLQKFTFRVSSPTPS